MQQQREQEIEQLIRDYRKRGQVSRKEFCRTRGMTLSGLGYYLRRYGKREARFAEVRVMEVDRTAPFALVLSNGRRIECSEAALAQLIRIAEAV